MERMLRGWFSLREEEVENSLRTSKIRRIPENKTKDKYQTSVPQCLRERLFFSGPPEKN